MFIPDLVQVAYIVCPLALAAEMLASSVSSGDDGDDDGGDDDGDYIPVEA